MKNYIYLTLFTFILVLFPLKSNADWVNLTGAENARNIVEIYIEDDHVFIKLEIYVKDMLIFEDLIPDDFFPEPIPGRPGLEERIKKFSNQTFRIVADSGKKLLATLDLVEPRMRVNRPSPFVGSLNPYTRQPIPGPPEDKRVLYAELSYPFKGNPKSLTFTPPH